MNREVAREMSACERHSAHEAYLNEFVAGKISGKEFVLRLCDVVGFKLPEARAQYQAACETMHPKISDISLGQFVWVPVGGEFERARVTSFYGSKGGLVAEMAGGARLPFSLFECRAEK